MSMWYEKHFFKQYPKCVSVWGTDITNIPVSLNADLKKSIMY